MTLCLVPPTDPVLWTPAEPVTDIATQVLPHIDDMVEIARENRGAGLAAPQVGIGLQFFLMGGFTSILWTIDRIVINPLIISYSRETETEDEGCLSFPGQTHPVIRSKRIRAKWLDETGKSVILSFSGRDARVFQHEADHLAARLIFPRPSL